MTPPTPPLALTELEERLAAPGGQQVQEALLQRLDALAWRLRQELAASVPRADYPNHAAAIDAVQAAREVLAAWPVSTGTTEASTSPFPLSISRSEP